MVYKLIFVISLCVAFSAALQCPNFPQNPEQVSPPPYQKKFRTNVEIVYVNEKKSADSRWLFDADAKKASIEIRQGNKIQQYIVNYNTDELYSITYLYDRLQLSFDNRPLHRWSKCDTYSSLASNNIFKVPYGFDMFSYSFIFPQKVDDIFRFYPQYFQGRETIRGIYCDVFVSCRFDQLANTNYIAKYYFASDSNRVPKRESNLPVRVEYTGDRPGLNGQMENFTVIHEFHEYRSDILRPEMLDTPGTVYCDNRKQTQEQPPQIGNDFRFSVEISRAKGTIDYIADLVYSSDLDAIRYTRRSTVNSTRNFNSLDAITYINDYHFGVTYGRNERTGACDVRPLLTDSFDNNERFTRQQVALGNEFAVQLKSPTAIFALDLNYTRTGSRRMNGVDSDIFIAKSQSENGTFMQYYEYAFSSNDVLVNNGNEIDTKVPVVLTLSNNLNRMEEERRTFYKFSRAEQDISYFDISQCYEFQRLTNSPQYIRFQLIFRATDVNNNELLKKLESRNSLRGPFHRVLANMIVESPMRLQSPTVYIDRDLVYVRSAILPNPNPINLFTRIPATTLATNNRIRARGVTSLVDCAATCLTYIDCMSFDFDQYRFFTDCFLNRDHVYNTPTNFTLGVQHYARNSLKPFVLRNGPYLWNVIQNSTGRLQYTMNVTDPTSKDRLGIRLSHLSSRRLANDFKDNQRYGTTEALSKYALVKPKARLNPEQVRRYQRSSVDDCARVCNDEIGFECNAFHYCFLTNVCVLSKETVTANETEWESIDYCDIYEKDALGHYKQYPLKAIINPKEKSFKEVKTASECAKKCTNELNVHCRSFNFCPGQNLCYLSERHMVDGSFDNQRGDLVCDHYSRNFVDDFQYINTVQLPLVADAVLKDSSLEACSAACVSSDGMDCRSFDFCSITKTCLLNEAAQLSVQAIPTKSSDDQSTEPTSDLCAHYRRQYFYATSIFGSKNDVYDNSGVLVILSLIFGVVSLSAGAGGTLYFFLVYSKK